MGNRCGGFIGTGVNYFLRNPRQVVGVNNGCVGDLAPYEIVPGPSEDRVNIIGSICYRPPFGVFPDERRSRASGDDVVCLL
jgi:hypothetical protein